MFRLFTVAAGGLAAVALPASALAGWTPKPLPANAAGVQNAHVVTFAGTRRPDGTCRFSGSMFVPPGQTVRADEIATDYDTCRTQYRVGTIAASAEEATPSGSASSEAQGEGAAARNLAGSSRALVTRTAAYVRQWFEDPPGLDVAVLRDSLQWNHTASCISYSWWRRHASWTWWTGWSLESVHDYFNPGCGSSSINSTAHMRNSLFCRSVFHLPETVDVYFDTNRVVGYPSGGYRYRWDYRISSTLQICRRFLSHHVIHGYTSPWN